MKIAHTGDWHIWDRHKYSINGSRLNEIKANCMKIVIWCIKNKVDVLVIAGDIFQNHNPSEKLLKIFAEIVNTAIEGGVLVRVIIGNHDTNGLTTSLDSLDRFFNSHYDDCLEYNGDYGHFAIFKHIEGITYTEKVGSANIVYVPWCKDINDKCIKAKEYKAREYAGQEKYYDLLFSHASIRGALSNTGHRLKEMEVAPVSLTGWDYVGFADFHKWQKIGNEAYKKKNQVYYCGSPFKIDWGERDNEKYFNVVTIPDKVDPEFKVNRVKIPDVPFIQLDIDYEDLDVFMSPDGLDVKDAFIKMFVTTAEHTKDISGRIFKAKEQLLKYGARDVYAHIKKRKADGVESDDPNEDIIELDFEEACKNQIKKDGIEDGEYWKYIQSKISEFNSQEV